MHINTLSLECTRRCNLQCAHCLRGNAQRMDMSRQVLFEALKDIEYINCLNITGGEPTMRPEFFEDLMYCLRSLRIEVSHFDITTNAFSTRYRQQVIEHLNDLYDWCDETECCSLSVCGDQYHGQNNYKYYINEWGDELPYFDPKSRSKYMNKALDRMCSRESTLL